jgi:sigma-B regulation protein RsbU (phosphoserine phosphatase)
VGPEAAQLLQLRFRAQADRLKDVRAAVRDAVTRGGCTASCTRDVVLAVDEACQNIIRHAYEGDAEGEIVLEIERQDDQLVFWLRDFAPRVDVSKIAPRDLDDVRPGGLGTHLIRQVMDEAGFVALPSSEGNLFRMCKRIG